MLDYNNLTKKSLSSGWALNPGQIGWQAVTLTIRLTGVQ